MEVIKILLEHVDTCLYFHPGWEDGDLPGLSSQSLGEWEKSRMWQKKETAEGKKARRSEAEDKWVEPRNGLKQK